MILPDSCLDICSDIVFANGFQVKVVGILADKRIIKVIVFTHENDTHPCGVSMKVVGEDIFCQTEPFLSPEEMVVLGNFFKENREELIENFRPLLLTLR